MELRQLQIFLAVAEELNFTRAAERAHCVQSNVTAQIQSLEQELGTPLFERLGRRVLLTDAGQRFLPHAEKVLGAVNAARKAVNHGDAPQGPLNIGTSESVLTYRLPGVLKNFREAYPAVELVFRPCWDDKLTELLESGKVDLAITMLDEVENPRLQWVRLLTERMVVIAAPDHPLGSNRQIAPDDLNGQNLLLTEPGCAYRLRLDRIIASRNLRPANITAFTSSEAIKECVALGMGLGVLPRIVVSSELRERRLVALEWQGPALDIATHVVWHKDKWRSAAFEVFLQTLEKELTEKTN